MHANMRLRTDIRSAGAQPCSTFSDFRDHPPNLSPNRSPIRPKTDQCRPNVFHTSSESRPTVTKSHTEAIKQSFESRCKVVQTRPQSFKMMCSCLK